jgi:hypothetical protein
MPHIRLILQDDQGNPIPGAEERIYQLLRGELETLDQIEQATEEFGKREALPQIEHSLLSRAPEQRFVVAADRGGKQDLPLPPRLNGKERVRVETIHGSFEFAEQRFLLPDGSSCRYLKRTGQGLRSSGIEEFCLYYCNRLSFAEVGKLVERVAGERLLCDQTLWNWVQNKAREVSTALSSEVGASRSLPMPSFAEALDIYDADAEEVLVSTDAIEVKAQKPSRERHRRRRDADGVPRGKRRKRRRGSRRSG